MDFYIDLGVSAILRLLKDRRGVQRYYSALAKVFVRLEQLRDLDQQFADAVDAQVAKEKSK